MRINHFNSLLDGGAATAARRLHAELLKSGVDSRFHYSPSQLRRPEFDASFSQTRWKRQGLAARAISYATFRKRRQALKRLTRLRPDGEEVFTSPYGAPHTAWNPTDHEAEILQLHWVAKFLDYPSFFGSLDPGQPVVWTLHDMNAFTGGCHFSDGCDRFKTGCGGCPQLPSQSDSVVTINDASRHFFQVKQASLVGANLHVVAPSRWLCEAAKSSPMFAGAGSISHIPYGVPVDDFYPMDRSEARARLGIDPDVTLFCFGAMDVKSRRKGSLPMLEALSHIADLPNVEGLVFGNGDLPESDLPRPPLHHIGAVHGLLALRTAYSAADVFVLPSLEDNLPLSGLEAMACGTPIVGFDVGGIPDYVRPGQTGLLARAADSEDLGKKLRTMITDPGTTAQQGLRARRLIESEFSAPREAAAYRALYTALLDSASATRPMAA
ncbi:MAG: glycosyltransferase [Rubripirellula sp.]